MRLHDQVLSEEEYEQLPVTLQRKYFSSLERLRLAQDGTGSSPNSRLRSLASTNQRPWTSHRNSLRAPSVSSAGSLQRSFSVVSVPRKSAGGGTRLRRQRLRSSRQNLSPACSLINPWDFAALPEAVQRKHFSPQEQYLITSRLNPVVLDAADEALYKQYQRTHQSGIYCSVQLVDGSSTNEPPDPSEEGDSDMEAKDLESFRWLDSDQDLDLKLDDYHAISADINKRQQAATDHRRSYRRGLSFSNVSFRRRSSSSTSVQVPAALASPIKNTAATAPTLPSSHHHSRQSTSSTDATTTHYQDPSAKMKLRVYLASPQKFDEALEFGFPSLHKDAVQPSGRPRTSPGFDMAPARTFFADDTPSLSEDDRDEESDYLNPHSPRTPIEMGFPSHRSSYKTSTDRSSQPRVRLLHACTENYTHASASDREMTLRMTLTRPELRALEETEHTRTNPINVNETPLEKASLIVPVGCTSSIWDELPEEPSRMKRLFKKLKGRG